MAQKRKLSYRQSIAMIALISVLPLYLYFIWVYQVSYSTIQEDLLASISIEGEKIVEDVDREISNLTLRLKECLNLLCTRRIMLEDSLIYSNYEIISAKQELAEIATVVLLNSQILESFHIFFPRTGTAYTGSSGWNAMTEAQWQQLAGFLPLAEERLVQVGGETFLLRTNRRTASPPGRMADIMLVMRISEERLRNVFAARLPSRQRAIFLIHSDTGTLLASTNEAMGPEIARLHAQGAIPAHKTIPLADGPHYILTTQSSLDSLTLYYVVSEEAVTAPMSRFTVFLIVSLVLLALILLLLFGQSYFLLYKPVYTLLGGFRSVRQGNLNVQLSSSSTREFDALNHGFNEMTESVRHLIDQEYKLRMLAREAELRHLYSQINPHFLYNCFFTVSALLEEEDYECCAELASLLGAYLRYLTSSQRTSAKLHEEVCHAQAYANIQKMRFSQRVDFYMDALPESWQEVEVPRLILQPLLENAFEHGIKHRTQPGVIGLRFTPSRGSLTITIENDGDTLSAEQLESIRFHSVVEPSGTQGVALYNINSRLKLADSRQDGLAFAISPLGGLAVSFSLHRDP